MKSGAAFHSRSFALALAALAAGCANNQVINLTPVLQVKAGTPTDTEGRYLIDFGPVVLGESAHQPVIVLDAGRGPLILQPATVTSPFLPDVTTATTIKPGDFDNVSFGFTPTQLGPAQAVVTFTSDGGNATIVLSGTGVRATCLFAIVPQQIDFGTGIVGQTLTSAVQFANIGPVDCALSNIQITAASDPAFTLSPGQVTSGTATPTGGSFPISVAFTPTAPSAALSGTLSFQVGPQNTTVTVPLSGAATTAPCAFLVQPAQLSFASLTLGQSGSATAMVTSTSPAPCTLSGIQIESGSDPSYTLSAGQVTSGSLVQGTPFPIAVTFTPSGAGVTLLGRVIFHAGPPDTIVEILLTGSAAPCKFHVAPTPLAFGVVQPGATGTKSVQIVSDSAVACAISGVHIDPDGNSSFTLGSGQPESGTATAASPFTINVNFAPLHAGSAVSSNILLSVAPPATAVTVPISGFPASCPDPNPDGTCPSATLPIYVQTDTRLFSFDPATNLATFVATFGNGVDQVVDIGIDTAGNLLAINIEVSGSPSLYAVNATTGACTFLAAVADPGAVGLTVLSDGSPVVAGDGVEVLDPNTFQVVRTLVQPGQFETSGDVVGLPDGSLYWSVVGPTLDDHLVKIDPNTGETTDLGDIGAPSVFGLAYANGTLYGYTGDGQFLEVNPTTATSTVGTLPGNWHGATTNPVTWE